MKLFCLNGEAIRFNLIDIESDECLILEDLIKASGGEITDDEESIVKFTSKEAFGKNQYPRAKIYDVDFILRCIQEGKIIDAEPFRLSPKIPGDEYHMEHLLFGRCACNGNSSMQKTVPPNGSSTSTRVVTDSQLSRETDETMFTARDEPSSPAVDESVDESQMVVTAADLKICAPTLAGGDAAKARTESHEKRPCNLEFELVVQPKMAALEREATRLAAAKESNFENRQLQRSLRTRTKRNHLARTEALREGNLSDSENVDVENVPVKEEPISISSESSATPEKMVAIGVSSSPENAVSPKPKSSIQSDSAWIETRRNIPKVLSDVVMPLNRMKKLDKIPIPTDGSKLLNVCYKGLKPAVASLQSSGERVLSKPPKRKYTHEKSSDEASTSKRNGRNERRESLGYERSARKSNERKGGRESSDDQAKANRMKTKRQGQTTYSNGDGRPRNQPKERVEESSEEEEEDEEVENSDKRKVKKPSEPDDPTRKKTGMRKLFNPKKGQTSFNISRKDSSRSPREGIDPDDSSDYSLVFSSDEEVPKKKRFREKEVISSDSSDLIISDKSAKKGHRQTQRNIEPKPGPSGIRRIKRDFYIDDDESSDDDSSGRINRNNRLEKAGDCKQNLVIPKLERCSTAGKTRGQVWRSQLSDRPAETNVHIRHGPFTAGERNTMVSYLVRTRTINKAKGLIVWKSMIDDGFLKHRTPQSLQNHFKKVILPHIEDCSDLKPEDRQKFLMLRNEKSECRRK